MEQAASTAEISNEICEEQGNGVRGDPGFEALLEHAVFDPASFKPQGFLVGLLLFLSFPVLVGLCLEPEAYVLVRALRLKGRQGDLGSQGCRGRDTTGI